MVAEAGSSDIDQELKIATLEKNKLEKEEIASRIRNIETPRERLIKLLAAVLVPLVTATTALAAAYLSLVWVQDERVRVQDEKIELQKLKEADFVKGKYETALRLLVAANPESDRKVVVAALQDLLLGGSQPPPNFVNVVSGLVGHQDRQLSHLVSELLVQSGPPDLVAAAMSNRLSDLTGAQRFDLLKVISALPAHKIEPELYRLLFQKDAVVAGSAALSIMDAKELTWSRINLADTTKSDEEVDALFDLVLLQQNADVRGSALVTPLQGLFMTEPVEIQSAAARASCYFLQAPDGIQNKAVIRSRLNQTADVSPINQMIAHALLGEREDKEAIQLIYKELTQDLPNLAKVDRSILDIIAKRLNMPRELQKLQVSDAVAKDIPLQDLKDHIEWTSVPIAILKSWAASQSDSERFVMLRAREELVKRTGEDAISYFENDLHLKPNELAAHWAQFPPHYEKLENYVKSIMSTTDEGSRKRRDTFAIYRAIDKLSEPTHALELLRIMATDSLVNFVSSIIDLKNNHEQIIVVLSELKNKQSIESIPAALTALHLKESQTTQAWLQDAAKQTILEIEKIDLTRYFQDTSRFEENIITAMILVAGISDRDSRDQLEARLQKALAILPMITSSDNSLLFSVGRGGVSLRNAAFRPLYERWLPGFLNRYRTVQCNRSESFAKTNSIPYKAIVAKYVLGK